MMSSMARRAHHQRDQVHLQQLIIKSAQQPNCLMDAYGGHQDSNLSAKFVMNINFIRKIYRLDSHFNSLFQALQVDFFGRLWTPQRTAMG